MSTTSTTKTFKGNSPYKLRVPTSQIFKEEATMLKTRLSIHSAETSKDNNNQIVVEK